MKRIMSTNWRYCFFLMIFCFLLLPALSMADGIKARYLKNTSKVSVLELTVESPAPTSIIVKQKIPPRTHIAESIPGITKYAKGKGVATWLFKAPKPGVQRIRVQYQKPISGAKASAVIRCKSPRNGKLMTIHVK